MSGTVQLFFGASDVSFLLLRDGSLTYDKNVNQRWTCSFNLEEPRTGAIGANRPVTGQTFTLYEDGVLTFSGFIDQITEVALPNTSILQYQCQCSSWATVCDHRVVTADYVAGDIGFNVIQDIVTRFLAGDGITITTHVDGSFFLTSDLVLNPATVADAFDQLRDLSNRQWWIDENKDLHFTIIGNGANTGISITDNDTKWLNGTMQVKRSTQNYRNQQYVQTGVGLATASRTETFSGDGTTYFFVTKFPVTAAPTVTVNGVSQTIYQLGTDPYGQAGWYWNPSGPGVQQGQQIPPASGAIIQVTYDALTVNYDVQNNTAQQAARAAIEGDSGIWAQITNQNNIIDLATAVDFANGLLTNYAFIPSQVSFQTYQKGYTIGDYITLNVSLHGLSGAFTVLEVSATETPFMVANPTVLASQGGVMLQTITVNTQTATGNFVQWFTGLVNSLKPTIAPSAAGAGTQPAIVNQGAGIQFIVEEPSGARNGSNVTFTISQTPLPPAFWLYLNGIEQSRFAQPSPETTPDYSLSGTTITFRVAPQANDEIFVEYVAGLSGGSVRTPHARHFAGGTDILDWGHHAALQILGDLSIGIWAEFSSSTVSGGMLMMYGPGSNLESENHIYGLCVLGSSGAWNTIRYFHENGPGPANQIILDFSVNMVNTTPYYIGISRDNTAKTVTCYIGDGLTLTTIGPQSYVLVPTGGGASSCDVTLGGQTGLAGTFNVPLVGTEQEHYIWSRKLSAAEHLAAMQGSPSATNLQLSCLMGNTPEVDISGNGYSGTPTGTTVVMSIH